MTPRPRLYYGWVILAIGFVTVVAGYVCRNTFSVFFPAIVEEFGWGRGNTALIFSINLLVYGVSAPFVGGLVDRTNPRLVLAAGAVIMGAGVALCSQASAQWQFYLLYGVVASLGLSIAGWTPVVAIVSNWFVQRRALCMGVLGAGFGTSLVFAYVAQFLIVNFGWRSAYIAIGAVATAIIVPLAILFMRARPSDMGLHPDGLTADESSHRDSIRQADESRTEWVRTAWTFKRAVRTRQFWLLFGLAFVLLGIVEQILIAHQVYFYLDAGFAPLTAASFYSAFGICFVLGNPMAAISDRIGREHYFIPACLVCAGASSLLLLLGKDSPSWLPMLVAVLVGLSLGSAPAIFYATVADLFHGANYGTIVGTMVMGFALGGTLSPWLAGYLHDTTGTYTSTYVLLVVSLLITAAMMWLIAPRKLNPVRSR